MRDVTMWRTAAALSFSMAGSVAHADELRLPSDPECKEREAYSAIQNVIFLDRTTNPDDAARSRFRNGILAILGNHEYVGRLVVVEIRDNETQTEKIGEGCLDALKQPEIVRLESDNRWKRAWRSIVSKYREWRPEERSDAEKNREIDRQSYIQQDRGAAAVAIGSLIDTNRATEHDTEIARSLVAALQSECSGKVVCNVFMFSDLLDSDAKRAFALRRGMQAAGATQAKKLLAEYRPKIGMTRVMIRIWGFGGSDDVASRPLPDGMRQEIRSYWQAYLDTVLASAAKNSEPVISDMYQR
jgi:hypothetical protein